MTVASQTALRASGFINSIGVNVHMEYTDGAYASESNVASDLAYLGVTNIRDMIPNVTYGGIPAQQQVTALEALAASGIKMDLFVGNTETNLATDIAELNVLDTAHPNSIEAVEGLNEINNFPATYDGLTGQAGATALQQALYSSVKSDSLLKNAAVFDFTGGTFSTATPYGTIAEHANGSYTLTNGITGWQVALPTGVSTITIGYTGAAPAAGLFNYPGAGQETNLYYGNNGTLTFTYDNTSGVALETYVTVSAWGQTTTITGVSATSGNSGNLVTFDPQENLTGLATDANAHPYPSYGAEPGSYIASNYLDAYGTATPGPRVITEDGYDTDPNDPNGVSQLAQAQGDTDILLDAYKSGVSQTYLYELLDEKPDPNNTNSEMHFGLFNNDNTPKLAATAIHDLTTILADNGANATSFTPGTLDWSATGMPGTANSMLLEKSNGTFDLALWNETTSAASQITVSLGSTYQNVEVFDPITGSTPIETLSNVSKVTLSLGNDPLIIQVSPQTTAAAKPAMLTGAAVFGAGGSAAKVTSSLQLQDMFKSAATSGTSGSSLSATAAALPENDSPALLGLASLPTGSETPSWLTAVLHNITV